MGAVWVEYSGGALWILHAQGDCSALEGPTLHAAMAKFVHKIGLPSRHPVQATDRCAISGMMHQSHFVKISLPARVMRK